MVKIKELQEYFKDRLVKKTNLDELSINLNFETKYILNEVGLPTESSLLNFTFDEFVSKPIDRFLVIGDYGPYGDKILIDLENSENVVYGSSPNFNPQYICKNLVSFFECIFVYETLFLDYVEHEKWGNYYKYKQKYADYLKERLQNIDNETLNFSKSYFWGARIENIEMGI